MKTLALISRELKDVIDQVRSGEVSLFIQFVKDELIIDGQVFPPGKYLVPTNVELIDELERHYAIREREGKKRGMGTSKSNWAANVSGPFRVTHLLSPSGKPIVFKKELMLDRIQYGQFEPSSYSEELTRAIQVHEDYWAEGMPGINQGANILDLKSEDFTDAAAKRIDKIARKKK